MKKKICFFLALLTTVLFLNAQENPDNFRYQRVQGVYQLYEYSEPKVKSSLEQMIYGTGSSRKPSEPLKLDGMNFYYIFNSKGVVLFAIGNTPQKAFYDIQNGIKSGRITTGTYTFEDGGLLKMELGSDKNESEWIWSIVYTIILRSDYMTELKLIEKL